MNVMIDLETLGRRPGCTILSIGAVEFSQASGLGRRFYTTIDTTSCLNHGLHVDDETIKWWTQQSPEARHVITQASSGEAPTLPESLKTFGTWLSAIDPKEVRVWGNGADFDNAIMTLAYDAVGEEQPWKFWNNRCYRTLKGLVPNLKAAPRQGVYHHALDDAVYQAEHAIKLMDHLFGPVTAASEAV